jgi:hypothetical protein
MRSPYDPPLRATAGRLALLLAIAAWGFAVWLAIAYSSLPNLPAD